MRKLRNVTLNTSLYNTTIGKSKKKKDRKMKEQGPLSAYYHHQKYIKFLDLIDVFHTVLTKKKLKLRTKLKNVNTKALYASF